MAKLTRREISEFARSQRAIRFFEQLESTVGTSGITVDDLFSFLSTVRTSKVNQLERRLDELEVERLGRTNQSQLERRIDALESTLPVRGITTGGIYERLSAIEAMTAPKQDASLERRIKAIEDYLGVSP